MRSYSYSVTLRVWHPSLDPARVTATLGIEPETAVKAGEAQESIGRRAFTGEARESYWCGQLLPEDTAFSRDDTVQDFLEQAVSDLERHAGFFAEIRGGGGRVGLDVGAYGRRNCEIAVPASLIRRLSALDIDLGFDVSSQSR